MLIMRTELTVFTTWPSMILSIGIVGITIPIAIIRDGQCRLAGVGDTQVMDGDIRATDGVIQVMDGVTQVITHLTIRDIIPLITQVTLLTQIIQEAVTLITSMGKEDHPEQMLTEAQEVHLRV